MNYTLLIITFFLMMACNKQQASGPGPYHKTTVRYKTDPSIAPALQSMDIYSYAATTPLLPVILYVHGGGWVTGDKANQLENKLSLFNSLHYLFISVNYRLSPFPYNVNDSTRIKYPDHPNDVADAVKWIVDSISRFGGDPSKIVLVGHSAGAHLVSLLGTSTRFLPVRGIPLQYIKGIASFDTEGYDIPSQSGEPMYQNAFGTNTGIQTEASPYYNVTGTTAYPRFFIAKRGSLPRLLLADAFISKLRSAGVYVTDVNGSIYDHEGINDAVGDLSDNLVTPALKLFLQDCFQ